MMMDLKRGADMNTAVRFPLWFHDMETLSELLVLCEGKLQGWLLSQKASIVEHL